MTTRIIIGNSLEVLPTLEQNSIHCSVTSPPYYGLRKYAGDQACDWPEVEYAPMPGLPPITVGPMTCALGHEPTIEAYVGHLVAIYRCVWDVLRDDGVAWVVMGDSYSGYHGNKRKPDSEAPSNKPGYVENMRQPSVGINGIKSGDLMLVPHRLALALQGDGWTVRNDVVWAKVAPMPESVAGWRWERCKVKIKPRPKPIGIKLNSNRGDMGASYSTGRAETSGVIAAPHAQYILCPGCPKCEANGGYVLKRGSWRHTRSHEVVLMCSKGMGYFSNQETVRESNEMKPQRRLTQRHSERDQAMRDDKKYLYELRDEIGTEGNKSGRNPRSVLNATELLMTLRDDLTDEERKYVIDRLDSLGLL